MDRVCEVCGVKKHCIELDVEWTLYSCICEECREKLESENKK